MDAVIRAKFQKIYTKVEMLICTHTGLIIQAIIKSPRKPGFPFCRSLYGWEEKGEAPVESQIKMLLKFLNFLPLMKNHIQKSVECKHMAITNHL